MAKPRTLAYLSFVDSKSLGSALSLAFFFQDAEHSHTFHCTAEKIRGKTWYCYLTKLSIIFLPCRTTPSLSRNNSDASQYGGSQYSYSSAPSPLSPAHSPATPSRHAHPGYPSPAHCASSPLPRGPGGHMSLPLYSQVRNIRNCSILVHS
jgi:hypothetical protein